MPWGITFTDPFAAANVGTPLGIPLHPTQLYEAGAELLILGVLLLTERKGRPFAGRTFWLYMLLYAISRFIIEFYRGDDARHDLGMFSTSQFISIILAPLAIVMLVSLARRARSAGARTAQARIEESRVTDLHRAGRRRRRPPRSVSRRRPARRTRGRRSSG